MKIKSYIVNTLLFFKHGGYKRGGVVLENLYTMAPNNTLQGKNILITGGSSGIGLAVAKKCVDCGAHVIITGRNEDKLIAAKEQLGENCEYIKWDVTELESINTFMASVCSIFDNRIDCLVNNAGSDDRRNFYDIDESVYDAIMNVHVKAVYFLTQAVYREMESNHIRGNICMITSHSGTINDFRPYNLAKASIDNYVRGIAKHGIKSGSGIRCNAVGPGPTSTNLCKEFADVRESGNSYKAGAPANRYYRSEEIAEVVAFLLSDLSKCINGQIILCDGGKAIL